MASRTIGNDKHKHNLKTVNEEILGLFIDDRGTDKISEAFGWTNEKFSKCLDKMIDFSDFQEAIDKLYDAGKEDALPEGTKTTTLVDFLKSNTFKELGIKLEKPNDYLMIGFIYCAMLTKRGMEDMVMELSGNRMDGKKMAMLLEAFKKATEGRM